MASPEPESVIDAGSFGVWLRAVREALRSNRGMDVPCGDCVGCCTSGYSILLRPHDVALDVVPVRFQSSVPGLYYPHMQMKPDDNGHCPMFSAHGCGGTCSIYTQRPQTCLDYDCRIFTAAGIEAGDRPVINQRVRAWRFIYESHAEREAETAIRAAASFVTTHAALFPAGWAPNNPSGLAVLAVKVYELFLPPGPQTMDPKALATAIVTSSRAFDSQR